MTTVEQQNIKTRNTDHKIVETFANNEYITLQPHEAKSIEELIEQEELFSYKNYRTHHRAPIKVLESSPKAAERCLDMPLRLAGQEEYRLPTNWTSLKETLEQLISIEHANNRNWREYNTYLTVDVKDVNAGEQQRHGGLHVDGFQGERISKKTKITRNYVGTTNGGTEFWNQPFIVLNPAEFNIFEGFDLQRNSTPIIAAPNCFYFMDAYMVHESGYAEHNGERVFIRLTYDIKIFDRKGNTHNPHLDYDWEMVERNVWQDVKTPTEEDLSNSDNHM